MEVLDSGYYESPENEWGRFIVSPSMKAELKRCLASELKSIFNSKVNTSKIYVRFLCKSGDFYAKCKSKSSLHLIPDPLNNKVSYTNYFLIGYKPNFVHSAKLTIENCVGDWPVLDPSAEIEYGSLKMTLEFDEPDYLSICKLIERDERRKNGVLLEGFRFETRVKNLAVDVVFNIYLSDAGFDNEKMIDLVGNAISEYNTRTESANHEHLSIELDKKEMKEQVFNEEAAIAYFTATYGRFPALLPMIPQLVEDYKKQIEEHNAKIRNGNQSKLEIPSGYIHSFNVKSPKKKKVVSLNVDLGSSTHGLDYILNKLDTCNYPIEKVEVKG